MKRVGLALGSGGAKGLAHIEFLKVFDELGIKPCIISGASMGALLGSLYASGLTALEIEGLYKGMTRSDMMKLMDIGFSQKHGVVKGEKVTRWIQKHLLCQDFSELEIPLLVVATDFWKRKEVVIRKGKIVDAVRASIALPGIFVPYKSGDTILVDGGIVNPVPYNHLIGKCDVVVAIDVFGKDRNHENRMPNIIENLMHTIYIMYNTIEQTKTVKPDCAIRVNVNNVKTLDFHRYADVQRGVKYQKGRLKKFLKSL